jgi:hypothetical protein
MMETANWEVAPILRVRDVRTAAAYYRDRLGFDCPGSDVVPEPSLYVLSPLHPKLRCHIVEHRW